MSDTHIVEITCPSCWENWPFKVWNSVNVRLNPEMKDCVKNWTIFDYTCPYCWKSAYAPYHFLYSDNNNRFMIYYLTDDYTDEWINENNILLKLSSFTKLRIVRSIEKLREKIQIFEDWYDDLSIEFVKKLLPISHKYKVKDIYYVGTKKWKIILNLYTATKILEFPISLGEFNSFLEWVSFNEPNEFVDINIHTIDDFIVDNGSIYSSNDIHDSIDSEDKKRNEEELSHEIRLKKYGKKLVNEVKKAEKDADALITLYKKDPDFADAVAQEFWYDDYEDAKYYIDQKRMNIEKNIDKITDDEFDECHFCKNKIKKWAIKCQYCKEMLSENNDELVDDNKTKICPFCKNEIKFDAIKCQYCHEFLNQSTKKSKNTKNISKNENIITDFSKFEESWNRLWRWKFFIYSVLSNVASIVLMAILWSSWWEDFIIFVRALNFIFHIYLTSKRLHDIWLSWWLSLLLLIFPFWIIVLYFVKWNEWINRFWPNPDE